ncbi:hypothetical protein SAMN02745116_00440 [Pilibacter termitis]|uniref:Uncharacterized protein n=1 Tax=Pilibacter termitis TaxID=263852 RepID=A0A1T4KZC1_9ENTE|nr:hypothetical protein [Pilibacter termitis]SJZ47723.1 hypothetical protein SAMN02745116_00440 [Pilibacter termitis]
MQKTGIKLAVLSMSISLLLPNVMSVAKAEEVLEQAIYYVDEGNSPIPELKEEDYVVSKKARGVSWVKQAIKALLKSKGLVVELVEIAAGKTAAKKVAASYAKITKAVEPLLKWADVPVNAVKDAVIRGLVNGGMKRSEAVEIAHYIKTILDWLI